MMYSRHSLKHDANPKKGFREVCQIGGCGQLFKNPKDRIRHATTHSKDKTLVCTFPDCGVKFKRRDNGKRHVISAHPVEPEAAASWIKTVSEFEAAAHPTSEHFEITDDHRGDDRALAQNDDQNREQNQTSVHRWGETYPPNEGQAYVEESQSQSQSQDYLPSFPYDASPYR